MLLSCVHLLLFWPPTEPYALQNVTVTTLRNDTALVEYDLPLDEWDKDKGSYPVDSIEVKVFSWNEKKTVYKEKILVSVPSSTFCEHGRHQAIFLAPLLVQKAFGLIFLGPQQWTNFCRMMLSLLMHQSCC